MKNLVYIIAVMFAVVSCSPEEYSTPANLTADQIDWEYSETDIVNEFLLVNNTPGVTTLWDLGNGVSAKGDTVTARYTFAGSYTVKLTVISQGGTVEVEDNIVTDQDNMAFLSGFPYDELTGGSEKTWAVDGYAKGAFGLGPTLANPLEWHSDAAGAREGKGLYDDRFTFSITGSGLTLNQVTNGDVYANGGWAATLGSTEGHQEEGGNDFIMPYDGGVSICTISGDVMTTDGGFLGYYAGATEFQLMTVTDDLLEIAFWDTNANFYWYTKLVPVDKLTPEPAEEVKELLALDIMDDFEGNGNIQWSTSDIDKFEIIDNFAPVPINESAKIAIYQKGSGEWTNVKAVLSHFVDLTERNVFTMKVFVPAFNDYVTECNPGTDWLSTHNLMPQVDVKLQSSAMGGNAWQTQEVRGHVLTEDQFGKWVELSFDFSDVTDRTDFDQIIIQLGNEGHCNSGIFYLDDFMLL